MKTILITGSARGIGKEAAKLAHKQGYKVIVHGRTDSEKLQQTHQEIEGSIKTFFDVADQQATHDAIKRLLNEVGTIDVLVNNAGISHNGFSDISEASDENALTEYRVNVLGAVHCIQAVLPKMLEKDGCSVISLSSIKGQYNLATISSFTYSASKAGVISITKALAKAYPTIRFNVVSPGYIETDQVNDWGPQTFDRINNGTIMGRIGTPGEVAPLIMFLASDEASYITGADFLVDGGYSIKGK